jgi:hypothetical protein
MTDKSKANGGIISTGERKKSSVVQSRSAREKGGIIAWLLISFLALCALAAVTGLYFVRHIKVHEVRSGNDVQVDTPLGSIHVQHNGSGHYGSGGIPVYPGARPLHNGESATVDLSGILGEDNDLHIVAGKWMTSDPLEKVQKYYENKFPHMSVIQHHGKVEMHTIEGHSKRVIALCDKGGSTEIALASVGEPKAN